MAISATSITNKTVRLKSPTGVFSYSDAVVYTAANSQAKYTIDRVFSYNDNGTWEVWTGDPILDAAGNATVSAKLGDFVVNIPAPTAADQNPPTLTLVSVNPTSITTAGTHTVTITISISDT